MYAQGLVSPCPGSSVHAWLPPVVSHFEFAITSPTAPVIFVRPRWGRPEFADAKPHWAASLEPARSPLRCNGSPETPDCSQKLVGRQRRACQKTGSRIPRRSFLLW